MFAYVHRYIASPEPTIDSSDSDVTSLAQRLHDCFSLIQDRRSTRTLCPETFRRVFEKIRPDEFEQCLELWVQFVLDDLVPQFIAIDGKETRGSYDREAGTKSLHLLSAWSTQAQLVLAQTKVPKKSN